MSTPEEQLNILYKISNTLDEIKGTSEKTLTQTENSTFELNKLPKKATEKMKVEIEGVQIMAIKGAKGDKGIDGKDGKDAKDGKDGKAGVDGKNGKDGKDGKDGKKGDKGETGKDGKNGKDAKDGVDGKDGEDGSPDTAEDMIYKINALPDNAFSPKIDASHIKNLPINAPAVYAGRSAGGGSAGHTIKDEGVALAAQANLNFTGTGVVATNNAVTSATDITINTLPGLYRNIWVDAASMVARVTNGAAGSTEEYATNDIMMDYYLFDSATEEGVQFKIAMPDEWDRSTIKYKIYWDASTGASAADTVSWGVKAGALSNDDPIDAALGSQVVVNDVVIAVGDLHVSPASGALTVGGTPALADMVVFQVVRNVSGTDDMTEDAKLLGISIQYLESSTEPSAW